MIVLDQVVYCPRYLGVGSRGWVVINCYIAMGCFIAVSSSELSRNKKATQSSNYSSGYVASKAVDGDASSYACTLKGSNNYWTVDLGVGANIEHLYITNYYGSALGELRNNNMGSEWDFHLFRGKASKMHYLERNNLHLASCFAGVLNWQLTITQHQCT